MTQLSIIVPVYNVEKYIRPCIESIFKQGLDDNDFEVIIVNDGTPDRSMEMIADIIQQHYNITVINQENQGQSIARNNGIQIARGDYILFIDSDDLLIDNTLPYLLDKAISSKADIIVADFTEKDDNGIAAFPHNPFHQKNGIIQDVNGTYLLSKPLFHGFSCVWRHLYKKDFLFRNNLRFTPHIHYEDTAFTYQCYAKAGQCLIVNWIFIIYRVGHQSITTSSFNMKKAFDNCIVISKIWELSKDKGLKPDIQLKIRDDVFSLFSMLNYLVISCDGIKRSEKKEVLQYLKHLVPDLSFKNGLKQETVSFFFNMMPSVYLTFRIFYANYLQRNIWTIKGIMKNKNNTTN